MTTAPATSRASTPLLSTSFACATYVRPGRPRTNGKAERFIQTLLREWAYAQICGSSDERSANLPRFLERYNFRRPHGSLGKQVPASRLNNLIGNYN